MNFAPINLTPSAVLALAFNDDDSLADARAAAVRTDVLKYAILARRASVISEALARAVLTADPDQCTAVIVPVAGPPQFYTLWRREDWLQSDYRRYLIALERAADRRRRDTSAAKAARVSDMARKLCEFMAGTESDYVQYRAKIADIYYNDAREDEAMFASIIAELVARVIHHDIYIPLSAEVLSLIADERKAVTATTPTDTTHDRQEQQLDSDARAEDDEGAAPRADGGEETEAAVEDAVEEEECGGGAL
jgi:hypothetical protein